MISGLAIVDDLSNEHKGKKGCEEMGETKKKFLIGDLVVIAIIIIACAMWIMHTRAQAMIRKDLKAQAEVRKDLKPKKSEAVIRQEKIQKDWADWEARRRAEKQEELKKIIREVIK
ncbi:MAG: hypothetical protein KKD69_07490 [Euryarchaeota archaeon]|nr:hypothetical protein [Euryarchaeota archaeon]